jgi:hypothetical protein
MCPVIDLFDVPLDQRGSMLLEVDDPPRKV